MSKEILKKRREANKIEVGDLVIGSKEWTFVENKNDYIIYTKKRASFKKNEPKINRRSKIYYIYEIIEPTILKKYTSDVKQFLSLISKTCGKATDYTINYFINNRDLFDLEDLIKEEND